MGKWLVPSLDAGGGMRKERWVFAAVPSWSRQSAEPPSRRSVDESCRTAQGGSKGDFPGGGSALGGTQLSLGGLPEKEMAQMHWQWPRRCWLSLRTVAARESFNEAFWIPSLAAAARYRIICMLMS